MTREEFEARMGEKVNEATFNELIHPIYMMSEMDKDAFCAEYKVHGYSKLFQDIAKYAIAQEKAADNLAKTHNEFVEKTTAEKLLTAERLVFIADYQGSKEAYDLAVGLAGQAFVTKFKVQHNIELNDEDKAYILNKI